MQQTNVETQQDDKPLAPILTSEEEFEIALCAMDILSKDVQQLKPEEQAYVMALKDYYNDLKQFAKDNMSIPELTIATAPCLFFKEDKNNDEQALLDKMTSALLERKKMDGFDSLYHKDFQFTIELECKRFFAHDKLNAIRSPKEQLYIDEIIAIQHLLEKVQRKHGLAITMTPLLGAVEYSKSHTQRNK